MGLVDCGLALDCLSFQGELFNRCAIGDDGEKVDWVSRFTLPNGNARLQIPDNLMTLKKWV